jgi:Fe-S-cluster formation regulator IscX/YfhJ
MQPNFNIICDSVLNESLGIPRKVFAEVIGYVTEMYKKRQMEEVERVTLGKFPPKTFNLDFSGTNYEHLNVINPKVVISFSSTGLCFFVETDPNKKSSQNITNGVGYINISFSTTLRDAIMDVVEHEFFHYIQYATVTYKIKTNQIPNIPILHYQKYVGGLPNQSVIPKDVTISGVKRDKGDIWAFAVNPISAGKYLQASKKIITIPAKTKEKALELFYAKFPSAKASYPPDKITPIDGSALKGSRRRVEHTTRPIEYYSDLLSMIRIMQYEHDTRFPLTSKEAFFNAFIQDTLVNVLRTPNLIHAHNTFNTFRKNTKRKIIAGNKSLYKTVLQKMYSGFMNEDTKKTSTEIKDIVQKYDEEIMEWRRKRANMREEPKELGVTESDFHAKTMRFIRLDDWLVDLDDNNTDVTESIFSDLGITERMPESGYSYYPVAMAYTIVKNYFKKLGKLIRKASTDPDPMYVQEGKTLSKKDVYVMASKLLFNEIQEHLVIYSATSKKIPDELYDLWINQ